MATQRNPLLSAARVQGVSTEQTVKASAGALHRVVVANANAGVQTLTITAGATGIIVMQVPAGSTVAADFGIAMATSIKVTPSHANIDALIVYS